MRRLLFNQTKNCPAPPAALIGSLATALSGALNFLLMAAGGARRDAGKDFFSMFFLACIVFIRLVGRLFYLDMLHVIENLYNTFYIRAHELCLCVG